MELTHQLTYNNTTTTIEEPVGFDSLKTTMSRHEYHGMGVEVSTDNISFYGNAYGIIMNAYAADIDADVTYTVKSGNTTIYQGKVDLSTVKEKTGDYQRVSAQVGEIGVKTTFNNRIETEVDLNTPKTVDGTDVTAPDWRNLYIPFKHLLYTIESKQDEDIKYTMGGGESTSELIVVRSHNNWQYSAIPYMFLPIGKGEIVEVGAFSQEEVPYTTDDVSVVDPQFISDEDHQEKYGTNTTVDLDIKVHFKIEIVPWPQEIPEVIMSAIKFRLVAKDGDGHQVANTQFYNWYKTEYDPSSTYERKLAYFFMISLKTSNFLLADNSIKFYLEFSCAYDVELRFHLTLLKDSFFKMRMFDTLNETFRVNANMLLVHDALNVVAMCISENGLDVKSEWYRSPESKWNSGAIGGGACKAITNGYKIRGLYTNADNERNMPLSFKALMESLSALDCIGWGFSTESGTTCIRVERWDWFYKSAVLLTLTKVAEVTREVYTDRIPTELEIGYKKYATDDQYNAIDSPHGTRKFTNGIKAVSKSLVKTCDFIADNYAIEETRRANFQLNETEESSYDSNIFVFELLRAQRSTAGYSVGHTALNATNVGNASEFINAKLTPRHMAARWRSYLFATNNNTPYRFTSGEINYRASFSCVPTTYTELGTLFNSLQSLATNSPQTEDDELAYTAAIFKAEKITFSCPISLDDYNTIKANPYGLISVNGMQGWIMDFKFTFATGMADFTLLAKNQ